VRHSFSLILGIVLAAAGARADTLDALVVGSAVADVWTTERGLQANPSLREANPLLQSSGARVGAKALATTVTLVAAKHLERRGHRNWSRAVRVSMVVLWSGAAVNNAIRMKGGAKP
jgi:hypothetical protein